MIITRSRLLIPLILVLAAALTWLKIPLASSQGLTLAAAQVEGDLPLEDPAAAAWQQATAVEVPLSAQNITKPMLLETKVKAVSVRALYNATDLAFLVEWADDTENDSMVRVQDFRDAVAVQFPLVDTPQPFYCMGQQGGNVNIWHWKADWQADMVARQDMHTAYPDMYADEYSFTDKPLTPDNLDVGPASYTDPNYLPALAAGNLFAAATHDSPVEDIVAGGFGALTAQPLAEQNVQGHGVWADGKWQVIFSRALASSEADDVTFDAAKSYSVAFAAWDGANEERNGQKSVSQWVTLQFGGAGAAEPGKAEPTKAAPGGGAAAPVAPSQEGGGVTGIMIIFAVVVLVLGAISFLLMKVSQQHDNRQ
jgi:hypothetical protein